MIQTIKATDVVESEYREKGEIMQSQNIKLEAHTLIDNLSDEATWDDLMQKIYVRQAIESGLSDSRAGRGSSV